MAPQFLPEEIKGTGNDYLTHWQDQQWSLDALEQASWDDFEAGQLLMDELLNEHELVSDPGIPLISTRHDHLLSLDEFNSWIRWIQIA